MIVINQEGMHSLEAKCSQESPPLCQAHCPFNVDVRGILNCLAEGKLREARKLLQRNLPLPNIFGRICEHPCETACLRKSLGGALSVHSLEHFLLDSIARQSGGLPMPPKRFTMAVLGLGPAGLVCAADLAQRGYKVLCFHTGKPFSKMQELFPCLQNDWIEEESKSLALNFHQVDSFSYEGIEADAIFIDAGATGCTERNVDPETFFYKEKICIAGWNVSSPAQAGGEGRRAGITMERLAAGVSLSASRGKETRSPHMSLEGIAALARNEDISTKEEAEAEAKRCLNCQCLRCVEACAYLRKYKGYPKVYARMIFNNLSIAQGIRRANGLITGCALCGQCEELCPDGFSMSELCRTAREHLVENGFMPESAFEFALEEMDACPSICSEGSAKYVFFPGCQLAGTRPEQVQAVYDFLRKNLDGDTSFFLSCCGIPAHWAGEKKKFVAHLESLKESLSKMGHPIIITACATCLSVFREFLPDYESTSLWEILDSRLQQSANSPQRRLFVQDPCGARKNPAWQQSVRSLALKCGVTPLEPKLSGSVSSCCGYGGNQWCSDPEAAQMMAQERAKSIGGPALTSCAMCRERLAEAGRESWHIIDLLPFVTPHPHSGTIDFLGSSARRAGRKKLAGERVSPLVQVRYLGITLAELEKKQILQEDIEGTLQFGEASGKFFREENGHKLTSWRPRKVTFWVEYTQEEDGSFVVYDAWCHRMRVPGAGGEDPRRLC